MPWLSVVDAEVRDNNEDVNDPQGISLRIYEKKSFGFEKYDGSWLRRARKTKMVRKK